MTNIVKASNEQGYYARAQRRFLNGSVQDVDTIAHTCAVVVGAFTPDGTQQTLQNVNYNPASPPFPGQNVQIAYANDNPHTAYVAGTALATGTSQSTVTVQGAVTSIQAGTGGAGIQGAAQLLAGTGVTLSESGQAITINASGTSGVTSLQAGTGGTPITGAVTILAGTNVTVSESGSDITINSTASGGVTALNTFTGSVTIAAGTGITVTNSSGTITLAASGTSGVTSLDSMTGAITVSSTTEIQVIGSSNNLDWALTGQCVFSLISALPYTITSSDKTLIIKPLVAISTATMTLPSASANSGRVYYIKNGSSTAVAVQTSGSDKIDNTYTSYTLNGPGVAPNQMIVCSDGISDWWILG